MSQVPDWEAARAAMLLDQKVANLNTGSFGPLPRSVFDRVTELRHRLAEEPMDFLLRELPPLLWQARERLGLFVGADPGRMVFTANVTTAVNIVASGLTLTSPGEILLSDHEYGAMHWCWERAAQRQNLSLRTFPLPILTEDPQEIVAAMARAITPETRLAFFSHVLSPTGLVLPVREMCAEARRRGVLTMVDGAHAPAMVPLNLEEVGADFYGANGHKWLLAPTGSGFLYLGRGSEDRLQPLQVSWGWKSRRARMDDPDRFGSTSRIRLYEFEGVRDYCPWLAVPAAIDFQTALGFEAIRIRNEELSNHVRERLGALKELTPVTPRNPALHGFMTAFRLSERTNIGNLRDGLWDRFRVEAALVDRPDCWMVRASTHFYNTHEEIDRLGDALAALL